MNSTETVKPNSTETVRPLGETSPRRAQAKPTAIILLAIVGLMFAGLGCTGIKQADMDAKDREIKILKEQLAMSAKVMESFSWSSGHIKDAIYQKDAAISEKDTTIKILRSEIRAFLVNGLDISESDIPKDDAKLDEYGLKVCLLMEDGQIDAVEGQAVESITFALRVNPDNSPISPTAVFKSTDRRIYACFKNQGAFEGLTKVVTRWTNKTTKEVIKLETKPIDPNASYNFIWVEKKEGWPAGEYAVELLNTKTLALIGQGGFKVVPGEKVEDESEESKKDDLPGLEFILTGTIVEPNKSLAFIANVFSSEERICKEGDFLDSKKHGRWTIFSIKKDKVVIRQYNKDGSVAKEHILRVIRIKARTDLDDDIVEIIKGKAGAAVKIVVGAELYSPDKRFLLECSFNAKDDVFQLWIIDKSLGGNAKKRLLFEYPNDASALWSPDSKKIILNVSIGRDHPIDVCIFELNEDLRFIEDKDLEQLIVDQIINQILKDNNLNYLLITGVRWIGDDTFIVRAYYPDKVNLQYEVNLKTKLITEIK
ncbi:MAG TPA: hypothetical protein VJC37_07800 [Planctomycetota bacterium]|nr:hypothetical protein [Planctomycetota bacterium]